jgi:hypothetical protein
MSFTLTGDVHSSRIGQFNRDYFMQTIPFSEARKYFKCDVFNASNGSGEQRAIRVSHAKKLREELRNGRFVPRTVTVGTRPKHRRDAKRTENDGQTVVTLHLEEGDYLPLTDGGHEFWAIEDLVKEGVSGALEMPISFICLLDGDPGEDFVNLQKNLPVDKSHMLSISVRKGSIEGRAGEIRKMAWEVARMVASNDQSPFYKNLRFDSRGSFAMPVTTICSIGPAEAATSLLGAAAIALSTEDASKDAAFLSNCVVESFGVLQNECPDLLACGRVLTPPPDGSKGASTIIVGVASLLAFRLITLGRHLANEEDLAAFVDAARKTLDHEVHGSFTSRDKRRLMGEFAKEFLKDIEGPKHEGVPLSLLRSLSTTSLGLGKLPKVPKPKQPPKPRKKKAS